MAIFGKDYSAEFELLGNQISEMRKELLQYHLDDETQTGHFSDDIKDNTSELIRLKSEVELMKNELGELKTMISDIRSEFVELKSVEIPSIKISTSKIARGEHISKFSQFNKYREERLYDMRLAQFYSIGGNGSKKTFNLNFRQLVAIINGYKNGLSPFKMSETNPILTDIAPANIRNYIYIWRAGGFNKAIETTARKLGFNPEKLISHECEDL